MKTTKHLNLLKASVLVLSLLTASCQKGGYGSNPTPNTKPTPPALTGVKLTATGNFGNILTDNNGRSLYFFSNDVAGNSTCKDGCAVSWPAFYVENPTIGNGLDASDFAVINRPDGNKQTTYKGWPLYYFMNDANAGDIKGDATDKVWYVAKPDYSLMVGNAQLVGLDSLHYNSLGIVGDGASQYLTDPYGRTLYQFKNDQSNKNAFTKADFSNNGVWPIDTIGTNLTWFPSILDKTKFVSIDVAGKKQIAYKGHPMYFFGRDAAQRGNTKGVSAPTPGAGIFKILNTDTPAL